MDQLVRHPVHRALTRPQMFAGVTYNYFIINAAVTTEVFLITGSWLALPAELAQGGRFEIWSRKQRAAAERALCAKLGEAWQEVRDQLPAPAPAAPPPGTP